MKLEDNKDKIIFIAWESHRRTVELCKYFGIKLIIFSSKKPRYLKHPIFIVKTVYVLICQRPKCLIIQNPSIVLALIGCILKRAIGYILIVDAHNVAILPENIILKKVKWLYDYIVRKADVTIVTNEVLADIVRSKNGNAYILPDKLPSLENRTDKNISKESFKIACISTFNSDEPYEVIMTAARSVPHVKFYMTGNYKKLPQNMIINRPDNMIFTGYLPDEDYVELMCSVDLIVDLTYRENCLVCGAYEAIAIGKPLILSNKIALRTYFNKGVVFTNNNHNDLVESIYYAMNNIDRLNGSICDLKHDIDGKWQEYSQNLSIILNRIVTGGTIR